MAYTSYGEPSITTLLFTSFFIAILLNGIASTGPIMTTYGGSKQCEDIDQVCKTNRTWFITLGIIFIIAALSIATSSIAFFRS